MWRYKFMRGAVNGLDRGTHAIFDAMRWGIDRLERREEIRKLQAPSEPAVDRVDEAGRDSFPAGDAPSLP
jgi:hypothetical protein